MCAIRQFASSKSHSRATRLGRLAAAFFLCLWFFGMARGLWAFPPLMLQWAVSLGLLSLALTDSHKVVRAVCAFLGILFLAMALVNSPKAFPLHAKTEGGQFRGVSLADTLVELAKQRTTTPSWRFCIADESLASRPVDVVIPSGSTLEETLNLLAEECGAEWRWEWRKHGFKPIFLDVYLWEEGTDGDKPEGERVWVGRWGVY